MDPVLLMTALTALCFLITLGVMVWQGYAIKNMMRAEGTPGRSTQESNEIVKGGGSFPGHAVAAKSLLPLTFVFLILSVWWTDFGNTGQIRFLAASTVILAGEVWASLYILLRGEMAVQRQAFGLLARTFGGAMSDFLDRREGEAKNRRSSSDLRKN